MMKLYNYLLLVFLLGLISCSESTSATSAVYSPETVTQTVRYKEMKDEQIVEFQVVDSAETSSLITDVSAASAALTSAYPDFIDRIENNQVCFKDGSKMTFDDGKNKSFEIMLDDGDIEDMFFVKYDLDHSTPPGYLHDAGRSRSEKLFKKMYGGSPGEVRKKLVTVKWFEKNVQFSSVNGAADSLRKVAAEVAERPELKKYIESSGTFYWRTVRGAKRLSAHSYGIAFDIAVRYSDYWLWRNRKTKETDKIAYANKIPHELVEIFERYGFIWGGAWYHYDTMHFEFRPEIINYARQ